MIQKLLHNPMALKLLLATAFCVLAFMFFALLIRKIRKSMAAGAELPRLATADNSTVFTLATYQSVIQQLRNQDTETRRVREQEQAQAASNETINEAVLSNLSSGVLFFDRQGLLRQANRAAKSLLGYASPFSFHLRDVFRGVTRVEWLETGNQEHSPLSLVQALQDTMRAAETFPRAKADYLTPGGQRRVFGIAASAVRSKGGEMLGLCCIINDLTEMTELSQEVARAGSLASLGEISAGLVNDFKKSLNMIAGHAETLMREDSSESSRFYAEKILSEAESLSRIVSEFLEFANTKR